jgi:ubiquinone/menaquinone biosynthesis C-methylase UbiE
MPKPKSPPTLEDVRSYWQTNPLYSYEFKNVSSPEYFKQLDEIRRNDVERFAMSYWAFDQFPKQKVLDVGCGPGWIAVQYAKGGANVTAIDLTPRAVELAQAHLQLYHLNAQVLEGNAEKLSFPDNTFDVVVSSGVLHHTPDTDAAFRECRRVLKPGGQAKITLYRKGILHKPGMFALLRAVMRLLGVKHPGADMAQESDSVDHFIRQYDGAENPVGKGKTNRDWARALEAAGFRVQKAQIHFFPRRFLPQARWVPAWAHRLLDQCFGTMVYFDLTK